MMEKPPELEPELAGKAAKLLDAVPLWGWIAAAAVLAALIALAVILLMKRKKRKSGKMTQVTHPSLPRIANVHGVGKRDSQQDAFAVSSCSDESLCAQKGVLAVLADGMGGYSHGADISAIVVNTFMEGFALKNRFGETAREELTGLLGVAVKRVAAFMEENAVELGGSTLVAVLIKDGWMDYLSVGDSRLCLVRNGTLTTLNKAHNYGAELDELVQKGVYSKEYAESNPQRNALTSFIGIRELKKVDGSESPFQLLEGDRLILMSDGVFNTLSDEEILNCMKQDVYASAQSLDRLIQKKDDAEQDNYTAILIEYPKI